jgi:AcrR family transcriptional regulator
MSGAKQRAIEAIEEHLNILRKQRPTVALAEDRSAKGANTIKQILAAARKVFETEGHAGLSLRRVAAEAGIAVGNVNYYFSSKSDLLEAMFKEALAEYVEAHIEQFNADRDSPLDILLAVVTFYVRNSRQSYPLFFQMWGYAGADAQGMAMIRDLYRPIGRFIYFLVRAANPDFEHAEARRAVLQIFSLEEGMKLFIGMGPDDDIAILAAEEDIKQITRQIIGVS